MKKIVVLICLIVLFVVIASVFLLKKNSTKELTNTGNIGISVKDDNYVPSRIDYPLNEENFEEEVEQSGEYYYQTYGIVIKEFERYLDNDTSKQYFRYILTDNGKVYLVHKDKYDGELIDTLYESHPINIFPDKVVDIFEEEREYMDHISGEVEPSIVKSKYLVVVLENGEYYCCEERESSLEFVPYDEFVSEF